MPSQLLISSIYHLYPYSSLNPVLMSLFQPFPVLLSPVTPLSSQYFPIPTPYITFLLKLTQHFQILCLLTGLGSTVHVSYRALMSLVPPPSLWSPLPNRPGRILPCLHMAEPHSVLSSHHPFTSLCIMLLSHHLRCDCELSGARSGVHGDHEAVTFVLSRLLLDLQLLY